MPSGPVQASLAGGLQIRPHDCLPAPNPPPTNEMWENRSNCGSGVTSFGCAALNQLRESLSKHIHSGQPAQRG